MFRNFLKLHGGYEGSTTAIDDEFQKKTLKTIRFYGGDTNLLSHEGLRKWQPTVAANPWLFGGKLSPLTELFGDVTDAKIKAMERAVTVHLDKAGLRAAKRSLYAKVAAMACEASAVANLRQLLGECDRLLGLVSPNHQEVAQHIEEIEKRLSDPEW